eukprot:COSAG06_NODE_69109_length_198_cov_97.010101_1_plen_28_part_10
MGTGASVEPKIMLTPRNRNHTTAHSRAY